MANIFYLGFCIQKYLQPYIKQKYNTVIKYYITVELEQRTRTDDIIIYELLFFASSYFVAMDTMNCVIDERNLKQLRS